jgi:hypothetical protein
LFDFAGAGKHEMPLKAGDLIDIIQRGPAGGWSKGCSGSFPTDYVQFLEVPVSSVLDESKVVPASHLLTTKSIANKSQELPHQLTSEIRPSEQANSESQTVAVVKFSRASSGPTELTITKGESILVLNSKDKDWWYGSVVGKPSVVGYFPSNYVEIKPSESFSVPTRSSGSLLGKDPQSGVVSANIGAVVPSVEVQNPSVPVVLKKSYKSTLSGIVPAVSTSFVPSSCSKVGLSGSKFPFCHPLEEKTSCPVWKLPLFIDLFAGGYRMSFENVDFYDNTPVFARVKTTLDSLLEASKYVDLSTDTCVESVRRVFDKVVYAIRDALDISRLVPARTEDMVRLYTFLVTFTVRVKSLRSGDFLLVPLGWSSESGEYAIFLVLMKENDANFGGYAVSVINGCEGRDTGMDYHLPHVNPVNGFAQRKLSLSFRHIPDERVQNTAFW